MSEPYTFSDIETMTAPAITYRVYLRYRDWVPPQDVAGAVMTYLERHRAQIERLLSKQPQRMRQIQRDLEDAGRAHCIRAKAEQLGLSLSDIYWYTPGLVDELKPMAMKPGWSPTDETPDRGDGKPRRSKPAREGNDLLAMVMDVRRAAKAVGWDTAAIVQYLGGRKPKGLAS